MSESTFALIHAAEELFKLREIKPNLYIGLLYPRPNDGPYAYGQPALSLEIKVTPSVSPGLFEFFACIRSIDDSGVSIFGPPEPEDYAMKRLVKFRDFILTQQFRCPSLFDMQTECRKIGVFPNYW